MTVRNEQREALARMRQEKVPIRSPRGIKDFAVRLTVFKEVRNTKADGTPGKVVKVVGSLVGDLRLERMVEPVHVEVDVEFDPKSGVVGEMKLCLEPALIRLLDKAGELWRTAQAEKPPAKVAATEAKAPEKAWDEPPTFTFNGKTVDAQGRNPRRVEWAKWMAALRKARKLGLPDPPRPVWSTAAAVAAVTAAVEGAAAVPVLDADESPVEQFDETDQADAETSVEETVEVTHG